MISRRGFGKAVLGMAGLALLPAGLARQALAVPSSLAVAAAKKALDGDFATAGDLAKQSGDAAAIKFVELLYLRDHGPEAGYPRIMAFLQSAPNWPLAETLKKRAEQALYENNSPPPTVMAHFQDGEPLTPFGALALARASAANGDQTAAKAWLRRGWIDPAVDAALEAKILSEFGSRLSVDDHKARLGRLIYAQEASAALRQSRRLNSDYQAMAKVADALIRFQGGADKKFNALPAPMRNELPLLYVLARYYRKNEDYTKARAILASVPGDAVLMGDASAWFEERRTIVRRSVGPMNAAHWKTAYAIARNHAIASGDFAVEGEFLAGWVALRYLRQPAVAFGHFLKVQKLAQNGTDRARAAYWMGRAQAASGNVAQAKAAYQLAAHHSTVFYGQLAREELGLGKQPEEITPGGASQEAQARVENDEVVRAFRILSQAGTKNQLNIFLWALACRFKSVDDLNAVANIVQNVAGTSWSLRLAKAAGQRGVDIDAWAYPVYGLPNWAQIGKPVEKSLVFALSRQESEFDPNAGSSVGAQGLMQLMPGTARLIARRYNIGFSAGKLHDANYNVKLGAAHLADLVDSLNGSYILTLVAYNAGPRRASDWVEQFGDPRGAQVDPVDWIECIPFNETRQYVQKVMQNLHVYRSRLAPETVRPMSADLKRGTPENVNVASTSPAKGSSACQPGSISTLIKSCD
ncbi:MAG: lytic transglycosylase domain-containing protein [Alphaproteobacteria bacterium]|nr:lytic transglycosylase domain-containing protein [Alphaproteobacteria bacterium]